MIKVLFPTPKHQCTRESKFNRNLQNLLKRGLFPCLLHIANLASHSSQKRECGQCTNSFQFSKNNSTSPKSQIEVSERIRKGQQIPSVYLETHCFYCILLKESLADNQTRTGLFTQRIVTFKTSMSICLQVMGFWKELAAPHLTCHT